MLCIPFFEDNEGAVQLEPKDNINCNSKHIHVRLHFLRKLVGRNEISVVTWDPLLSMRIS